MFQKECIVPVLGKVLEVYWIVIQSFSESSWSNQRIRCAKIDQTVNLIWASYRCSKCTESTISLHPLSLGTKLNTSLVPRWVSTGLAQTIVKNCQFPFPSVYLLHTLEEKVVVFKNHWISAEWRWFAPGLFKSVKSEKKNELSDKGMACELKNTSIRNSFVNNFFTPA